MTDAAPSALRLHSLSVRFGGLLALDGISLDVAAGEIVLVVGANGSGKTTLLTAISAFVPAAGQVFLAGRDVTAHGAWQRARGGIARTFQTPRRFDRLSPAEEMTLSEAAPAAGVPASFLGRLWALLSALQVLGTTAACPPANPVGQSEVEAAREREFDRLEAAQPLVVLLDEPLSGLGSQYRARALERVARLRRNGCAILLVEHRLELALPIAQRVAELHHGRCIFSGSVYNFTNRKVPEG